MGITTIKVTSETLDIFRMARIVYQQKFKITKLNDDEYVRYLLRKQKNE
tara:strand:- start:103 stop:249 length:147 start_codon:yes stop_codon:yes gene_type:complete